MKMKVLASPEQINMDLETDSLVSSPKNTMSPHSDEPIDYDTLITLAIERTSAESTKRSKRNQRFFFIFIATLCMILGMLWSSIITDNREEDIMTKEIKELEQEISELGKNESILEEPQNSTQIPLTVPHPEIAPP